MDLHKHLLKESNPNNVNLDCCGLASQNAHSKEPESQQTTSHAL